MNYTATGGFLLGGSANTALSNQTYIASGTLQLGGSSLETSPNWHYTATGNPLFTNLSAFWNLDEPAGSTYVDASGGNNLTGLATGQITGKNNNAVSFTTPLSSLTIPSNPNINVGGNTSFAISLWTYINGPTVTSIVPIMISKYDKTNVAQRTFLVGCNRLPTNPPIRKFTFSAYNSSQVSHQALAVESSDTNTWHHVVAQYDAARHTINLVVNNGTPLVIDFVGTMQTTTAPLTFGTVSLNGVVTFGGAAYQLNGNLDSIGLWNGRILTSDEISTLYNAGNGRDFVFKTTSLSLGGSAIPRFNFRHTASGGLTLGNTAAAKLHLFYTATSGLILNGTANAGVIFHYVMTGGLRLSKIKTRPNIQINIEDCHDGFICKPKNMHKTCEEIELIQTEKSTFRPKPVSAWLAGITKCRQRLE